MKSQTIRLISVIGPNRESCTPDIYQLGMQLGEALADAGYVIVCGGLGGLMEAVCKGARQSAHYRVGCTIGIIPTLHCSDANPYCDIVIPTGLGIARNLLVVNTGHVVVAVGGGAGTLSEIAFAWQLGKPIVCYTGMGGWSEHLAGQVLDSRMRSVIRKASTLQELMEEITRAYNSPGG
ncbi:MAG: hypothetical protein KatS3mg031_0618 [Chitinophagales bacterium]|nr:MAG: hypothetical protein KatS3mg031_0618 [Chitinophagales bacterium]